MRRSWFVEATLSREFGFIGVGDASHDLRESAATPTALQAQLPSRALSTQLV